MKLSPLLIGLAFPGLFFLSFNKSPENPAKKTLVPFTNFYQDGGYAGVRLRKVAAGEDANKNKILDESEKMKKLEPGAYDNIHFIDKRKVRIYGMGMEFYGLYKIRWEGNRMFFVISSDTTLREPPSESAHKFEVLYGGDTLVMIPPIYSFMLCAYVKEK